ncbi:hypothetical protein ACSBR2_006327 [Camellia fascicularis]
MEGFLAQNLTSWIASLDGSEKLNFRGFDINALFTLSRTPLYLPFLHAAARFWNPVTHVFSFGGQEVCPTFKDFQALMESERNEEISPQLRFLIPVIVATIIGKAFGDMPFACACYLTFCLPQVPGDLVSG